MIFDVEHLYTVDPETRSWDYRAPDKVMLVDSDVAHDEISLLPVRLQGLRRLDFVLFARVANESGVSTHPMLVTQTEDCEYGQGEVVSEEIAASFPERFITREFAKKALTLSLEELANFTIADSILHYIKKAYPGMRGLVR